ncbi:hypothetical protein ABBQ38_010168 [Trebouxia sp. C0009 RCD-2024]
MGPCINITAANPGNMLVKSYSDPTERYGVGQYANSTSATTRLFTSGFFGTNASVALSLAGTGSGSLTFLPSEVQLMLVFEDSFSACLILWGLLCYDAATAFLLVNSCA